jgi:hypothetical protein
MGICSCTNASNVSDPKKSSEKEIFPVEGLQNFKQHRFSQSKIRPSVIIDEKNLRGEKEGLPEVKEELQRQRDESLVEFQPLSHRDRFMAKDSLGNDQSRFISNLSNNNGSSKSDWNGGDEYRLGRVLKEEGRVRIYDAQDQNTGRLLMVRQVSLDGQATADNVLICREIVDFINTKVVPCNNTLLNKYYGAVYNDKENSKRGSNVRA